MEGLLQRVRQDLFNRPEVKQRRGLSRKITDEEYLTNVSDVRLFFQPASGGWQSIGKHPLDGVSSPPNTEF